MNVDYAERIRIDGVRDAIFDLKTVIDEIQTQRNALLTQADQLRDDIDFLESRASELEGFLLEIEHQENQWDAACE